MGAQFPPLSPGPPVPENAPGSTSHADPRPAFDPKDLLSTLWIRNLPLMRDRVTSLENAAAEAHLGPLPPGRRTEASDLAHKLAGSLGMFGYPRGTEIARELERILEADGAPDPADLTRLVAELRSALPL